MSSATTINLGGGGCAGGRPPEEPLGGRYQLGANLGSGGHGHVYEAVDTVLGHEVAVKLFQKDCDPARIRREIGVLRLLRVPGVVRFLDEGQHDGVPYLVMERIDGGGFPGVPTPVPWSTLAPRAISLLEILARVHPAGIVHRDLKPGNVLVDGAGSVTVVDFGISATAGVARDLTREGEILGTPAYLAPEQIRGEGSGPMTDLYAVGVMLYEALTGHSPHTGNSPRALFFDRLRRVPRPLASVAPDVPATVAHVIDQLLAIEADDRPRSADAVLALLADNGGGSSVLPWLGGIRPADAVVDVLRAGQSIDVTGPRGSGRTRVLREAHAHWVGTGAPAVWATPGRLPYESLASVVGDLDGFADGSLDEVDRHAAACLEALQRAGAALFADDIDACDGRTRRLVARLVAGGRVVQSRVLARPGDHPGALFLADLGADDLAPLFVGPERLFHRCSDAARTMHSLTGGRPARVAAEVVRWTRLGVATWCGEQLAVDQSRLDELDARPAILVAATPGSEIAIPPDLIDLVAWLVVAGSGVDVRILVRATGWRRYEVEARLEDLELAGLVQHSGEQVVMLGQLLDAVPWDPEQVRAAHRALAAALPAASPRRLFHLLAGQEPDAPVVTEPIVSETLALARREVEEGRVVRATTWLIDGLAAVRRGRTPLAERALLAEWLRVALLAGTATALDQVLADLVRARCEVADLEAFARAGLDALSVGGGERALTRLDALAGFADPSLELERQATRVRAARRVDLATERRVVESAARWAEERADAEARARASAWLGRLTYRECNYGDSARLHHAAAAGTSLAIVRITSWLDASNAEIWDLRPDDAARDARRARAEAERYRCVYHEARAEWLLRYAAYRDGRAAACDHELVALSASVGVPELEAQIHLTEAAVAWRVGDVDTGTTLAQRAAELWRSLAMHTPASTATALAAACRRVLSEAAAQPLLDTARAAWDPTIGLQIAGLVCMASPEHAPAAAPLLRELATRRPPREWDARLDVLSPRECFTAAGLPVPDCPQPPPVALVAAARRRGATGRGRPRRR
jgi:hypothetical protein